MCTAMINNRVLVLLGALLCATVFPVGASSDFSAYPCDIFTSDMCFRIPNGAVVSMSSPGDYYLYEVKIESSSLVTLYKGRAPESRPDKKLIVNTYNSEYGKMTIYASGSGEGSGCPGGCLDVYIDSVEDGKSTIHMHSALDAGLRGSLAEFISSFRPCLPLNEGGQRCKKSDVWSRSLLDALHKTM